MTRDELLAFEAAHVRTVMEKRDSRPSAWYRDMINDIRELQSEERQRCALARQRSLPPPPSVFL